MISYCIKLLSYELLIVCVFSLFGIESATTGELASVKGEVANQELPSVSSVDALIQLREHSLDKISKYLDKRGKLLRKMDSKKLDWGWSDNESHLMSALRFIRADEIAPVLVKYSTIRWAGYPRSRTLTMAVSIRSQNPAYSALETMGLPSLKVFLSSIKSPLMIGGYDWKPRNEGHLLCLQFPTKQAALEWIRHSIYTCADQEARKYREELSELIEKTKEKYIKLPIKNTSEFSGSYLIKNFSDKGLPDDVRKAAVQLLEAINKIETQFLPVLKKPLTWSKNPSGALAVTKLCGAYRIVKAPEILTPYLVFQHPEHEKVSGDKINLADYPVALALRDIGMLSIDHILIQIQRDSDKETSRVAASVLAEMLPAACYGQIIKQAQEKTENKGAKKRLGELIPLIKKMEKKDYLK